MKNLLAACLALVLAGSASAQTPAPLSQADTNAVVSWIARQVSNARQPYCYRQSYGRGVGAPLSTCGAGQQKNGALCYPNCNPGYGGAGPVCWQECPEGYTDTGAFCTRGASSRHISIHSADCPAHFHNTGTSCYRAWPPKSESLSHSTCPAGMHRSGAFCYSQCDPGYTNTGVSCYRGPDTIAKKSYGRGAGAPMGCEAGKEEDAGLCYDQCKAGFHGVGPVCWQNCPAGRTACGAGCAASTRACVASTKDMIVAPAVMVFSLATAGAGGEAAGAAKEASNFDKVVAAAKVAAKVATGAKALYETADLWATDYISDFGKVTTPEIAREVAAHFSGDALTYVQKAYAKQNLMLMLQRDLDDTERNALSVSAGFDPTGVEGVVLAYMNPKCASPDPFPTVKLLR
jgi:hypothetical protein